MATQPLATRMRPRSFDEVVGQRHLIGPGKALTALVQSGHLPSLLLWGPAGTGKTTLAYLVAGGVGGEVVQLSAVASGVADARKVMGRARNSMLPTVLFVDEVHRWSKAQQDVLLPTIEDGTIIFIGATTENPYFSLVSPLLSRCMLLRLEQLELADLRTLMERALADPKRGLGERGVTVSDEALDHFATIAGGDARIALTALEAAVLSAGGNGEAVVDLAAAEEAAQKKAIVYDRQGDAHYDVISAFIKSIRGSDPNRMIVESDSDVPELSPTAFFRFQLEGAPVLSPRYQYALTMSDEPTDLMAAYRDLLALSPPRRTLQAIEGFLRQRGHLLA